MLGDSGDEGDGVDNGGEGAGDVCGMGSDMGGVRVGSGGRYVVAHERSSCIVPDWPSIAVLPTSTPSLPSHGRRVLFGGVTLVGIQTKTSKGQALSGGP